jgi:hypothetical protein
MARETEFGRKLEEPGRRSGPPAAPISNRNFQELESPLSARKHTTAIVSNRQHTGVWRIRAFPPGCSVASFSFDLFLHESPAYVRRSELRRAGPPAPHALRRAGESRRFSSRHTSPLDAPSISLKTKKSDTSWSTHFRRSDEDRSPEADAVGRPKGLSSVRDVRAARPQGADSRDAREHFRQTERKLFPGSRHRMLRRGSHPRGCIMPADPVWRQL